MTTDDLRARLSALADEHDKPKWLAVFTGMVPTSTIRDILAATDPAPDEALSEQRTYSVKEVPTCHGPQETRRSASASATPATTSAVDPSATPASTSASTTALGDAARQPWVTVPGKPGYHPDYHPDPVHADNTAQLTQSERATYQSLRSRGYSHGDALSDALDGVDAETVRKDAGDEGVRRWVTTIAEHIEGSDPMTVSLDGLRQLSAALTGLSARLAEVTAERDALMSAIAPDGIDGHPCIRVEAYMKAMDDLRAAEARLGEGVVEWGVRLPNGRIRYACTDGTLVRDLKSDHPSATLVTRHVHTSPWVEVSE